MLYYKIAGLNSSQVLYNWLPGIYVYVYYHSLERHDTWGEIQSYIIVKEKAIDVISRQPNKLNVGTVQLGEELYYFFVEKRGNRTSQVVQLHISHS